jgi:hypothetical protein
MFDKLARIGALLPKIRLARALMVVALALFLVALYTAFENRESIYRIIKGSDKPLTSEYSFPVSGQTYSSMKHFVDTYPEVIFLSVWAAEPQANTRLLVSFYSEDLTISAIYEAIAAKHVAGIRLFTNDEKNDAQVVKLMNGEWMCLRTEDTLYSSFAPDVAVRAPILCRTSLPPYYGAFSGFIEVGLYANIHPQVIEQIKLDAVKISNTIFIQDLLPSARRRR